MSLPMDVKKKAWTFLTQPSFGFTDAVVIVNISLFCSWVSIRCLVLLPVWIQLASVQYVK